MPTTVALLKRSGEEDIQSLKQKKKVPCRALTAFIKALKSRSKLCIAPKG
jgi:hypothetical protein